MLDSVTGFLEVHKGGIQRALGDASCVDGVALLLLIDKLRGDFDPGQEAYELRIDDARLLVMRAMTCLYQHNLDVWTAALELAGSSSCIV